MKKWSHAPNHSFESAGTYFLTAATLNKELFFKNDDDLDMLQDSLLELAGFYNRNLEAWAIFPNHYHFVAKSKPDSTSLRKFISHLHASTALKLNKQHNYVGRKVWYQFWDTQLTFQRSYLARIKYVMTNPVKHKLVENAEFYKWCSASWFKNNASKSYVDTIFSFKIDNVNVVDDFY